MQFVLAHAVKGNGVGFNVGNTTTCLEEGFKIGGEIKNEDKKWEENGEEVPLIIDESEDARTVRNSTGLEFRNMEGRTAGGGSVVLVN